MNGVVVIDKPGGLTSFDVVARVRRALGERRVGHTGTLDPMATGVLPVCVGEATKLVPFLISGDKEYEAEVLLGVATDTLDATGKVLATVDAGAITREQVQAVLPRFVGTIQQTPPMHSALRLDGKRLYELARQGVEVDREARPVVVNSIDMLAVDLPRFRLRVRCGKGTYIRSIAADVGTALGVGAHLTALRRTQVGAFTLADAVAIEALSAATVLRSPAEALADHPTLCLDADLTRDVRAGKLRAMARLAPPAPGYDGPVRLLGPDGGLVAVAAARDGRLTLARVFC
jgi:tRNA pseudouridine55 synthase